MKNFPLKINDLFFLDEITSLCAEKDSANNLYILEKKAKTHLKKLSKLGFFEQKINYQLGFVIDRNKAYLVAKPLGILTDEEFLNTFQQQIDALIEDLKFITESSKSDTPPINLINQKNLQQNIHLKGGAKKMNHKTIYKDLNHLSRLENLQKLLKKEDLSAFGKTFNSVKNSRNEIIKKTSSEEHVHVEVFFAALENWSSKKLPQLKFWASAETVGVVTPSVSYIFHEAESFGNRRLKDFAAMLCLPPSKRPPIKVLANVFRKFDLKRGHTVLDKVDIINFM